MRRRKESLHPPADPEPGVFLPLPHLPFHVLLTLAEAPRHGWAIVKRIAEITDGPEPSSGSLYLAISRLKERGLVEDAPAAEAGPDARSRRNPVRLTALGSRVLRAETERMAGLVELSRQWTDASGGGG